MYLADDLVEQAEAAASTGDREKAIALLMAACRKINRYGVAAGPLDRIARELFAEAIEVRDRGDIDGAIARLVRSLELNPVSGQTRTELERLLNLRPRSRDLTTECFVF